MPQDTASEQPLSHQLRDLLAKRENARAELRLAEAEAAKRRAEVSRIKAAILEADVDGKIEIAKVFSW
jgi:hypothetical protein